MSEQKGAARSGVQSLEQGLRIASAFLSLREPQPLRSIAAVCGMTPSAAYRYLISLIRSGLVVRLPNGHYDLGPLCLELGLAGLQRLDATEVAARELFRFVEASGTTGMLSVWTEHGPIVLRWYQGREPVFAPLGIGTILRSRSATGRLFDAYLKAPHSDVTQHAGRSTHSQAELRRLEIRAQGFARTSGEFVRGLHAVAAPVFDGTGFIVAALAAVSAGKPVEDATIAKLKDSARVASADLGSNCSSVDGDC